MAYTIKGLAKANECETHDMYGLASFAQSRQTANVELPCKRCCMDRHSHTHLRTSVLKRNAEVCLSAFFY